MSRFLYHLRNWRAFIRSTPQRIMLWAGMGTSGALSLTIVRANGKVENLGVVSRRMITTVGVGKLAESHVGVLFENETFNFHDSGTGTAIGAIGNTALVTAAGPARVAGTQSNPSNGVYRTVATIAYTAPLAITEHGIFSASTAGTLLDRSVFAAINVVSGDQIQFQFDLSYASGG